MADNYLENRYEEVFGNGPRPKAKHPSWPSLSTLLGRNRSTRRYRQDADITYEQLKSIVAVNTKVASAMNRQALRFRLIPTHGLPIEMLPETDVHEENRKDLLADPIYAGPDSVPGKESIETSSILRHLLFREEMVDYSASAFIIIYSTIPEDRYIDIDLGISLQSMSLKAVEAGLNCLIKGNINKTALKELFTGDEGFLEPLAVLAVGKSAESVFLKPVFSPTESLEPYTKDGVHYVPKLTTDNLIIKSKI